MAQVGRNPVTTEVRAKKDLYNGGKCFTEGRSYYFEGQVKSQADLMNKKLINDLSEPHTIGIWYKDFEIVEVN
jgi:hypothetical protein